MTDLRFLYFLFYHLSVFFWWREDLLRIDFHLQIRYNEDNTAGFPTRNSVLHEHSDKRGKANGRNQFSTGGGGYKRCRRL